MMVVIYTLLMQFTDSWNNLLLDIFMGWTQIGRRSTSALTVSATSLKVSIPFGKRGLKPGSWEDT